MREPKIPRPEDYTTASEYLDAIEYWEQAMTDYEMECEDRYYNL